MNVIIGDRSGIKESSPPAFKAPKQQPQRPSLLGEKLRNTDHHGLSNSTASHRCQTARGPQTSLSSTTPVTSLNALKKRSQSELGPRHNNVQSFFKNGPIPASFCLFLFFSRYNFNTNWKKCRWCASDSNLGLQYGRRRRNHGAIAATTMCRVQAHVAI